MIPWICSSCGSKQSEEKEGPARCARCGTESYIKELNLTDVDLIIAIEEIRSKNNTYWMDLVRLAFELAPNRARAIMKNIRKCDKEINKLTDKLAEGGEKDGS